MLREKVAVNAKSGILIVATALPFFCLLCTIIEFALLFTRAARYDTVLETTTTTSNGERDRFGALKETCCTARIIQSHRLAGLRNSNPRNECCPKKKAKDVQRHHKSCKMSIII